LIIPYTCVTFQLKESIVAKYVEFPLEGGGSIVIEASDEPARTPSGFLRPGESADAANPAQASFDASVEAVRRSADLLVSKLRELGTPPDELEVSFNLKASGETGSLVVGRAGSEANFNVLLRWRTEEKKERGKDDDDERDERRDADAQFKDRRRRSLADARAARAGRDDDEDDDREDDD
jgi:hypothetical protein